MNETFSAGEECLTRLRPAAWASAGLGRHGGLARQTRPGLEWRAWRVACTWACTPGEEEGGEALGDRRGDRAVTWSGAVCPLRASLWFVSHDYVF